MPDNPGAQARIFLTDGGHDVGTYNNGHLTHKVPTYVVGFSSGVAAPEDQQRLQAIASETGGQFFPLTDSSQLQSVMNSIGARDHLPDTAAELQRRVETGRQQGARGDDRRVDEIAADRAHVGEPAGQIHDLRS